MTNISAKIQTSVAYSDISQSSAKEKTYSFRESETPASGTLDSGYRYSSTLPTTHYHRGYHSLEQVQTSFDIANTHNRSPEQVQIRAEIAFEKTLDLNLEIASENKTLAERGFHPPDIAAPAKEVILPETNILKPKKIITFSNPDIGRDESTKDIYAVIRKDIHKILYQTLKTEWNANKGEDKRNEIFKINPRTNYKIEDITSYLSDRQKLKEFYTIGGSMINYLRSFED